MSIGELGSLGEFLASLGVLVTLVFLVFQIRQNTGQIKLRGELYGSDAATHAALMGDSTHSALTKALVNPSDLSDEEIMRVWSYLDVFIAGTYATWSTYTHGLCDNSQWTGAKGAFRGAFGYPVGMAIWSELKKDFPRAMTEDLDAYLIEHGTDKLQNQFMAMLDKVRNIS
jgi:hypothetical protein